MSTQEACVTSVGAWNATSCEVSAVAHLLREWPLNPYGSYASQFDPQAYANFCISRVRSILDNPHSRVILHPRNSSVQSSACWSFLPWDTEQLGISSARVEWLLSAGSYQMARQCKTKIVEHLLHQCRAEGIHYLTARMHAGDLSSIHALEENGFELIDGIQTFSRRLNSAHDYPVATYRTRLYEPQDLRQILSIARSSYVFDRFHMDACLPTEAANRLNERWVENSCLGSAADAVVVALDEDFPVGYVTCQIDRYAAERLGVMFGTIGMVATDVLLRGRGVARAATYGALRWFAEQGVDFVEVGTQLCNIPAGRLYEQCGFRLVANSLTFRRLL